MITHNQLFVILDPGGTQKTRVRQTCPSQTGIATRWQAIASDATSLASVVAKETGIDRVDLRRRNLIPKEAFPYKTPVISTS